MLTGILYDKVFPSRTSFNQNFVIGIASKIAKHEVTQRGECKKVW